MKKYLLWVLLLMMGSMCRADDVTIRFDGSTAKVSLGKLRGGSRSGKSIAATRQGKDAGGQMDADSVTVTVDGATVTVESRYAAHKLSLRLTGRSDDGKLVLKTAGKATVTLDNLTLTSQEGAPLWLKNKKKLEIVVAKGTKNSLTITACNDTANYKAAVIWAKDKLLFSGKGTLNIIATGDGCRGIKTKKDITIDGPTINVTTSGDNLGEKPFGFPGFNGEMPDFGGGFPFPDFGGMRPEGSDSTGFGGFPGFPGFNGEMPDFGGGFPFPNFGGMRPEGNDSTGFGGFPGFPGFNGEMPDFGGGFPDFDGEMPDFGGMRPEGNDSTDEGGFGGFGGKHKYVAAAKGIASKGVITINSGRVTVRTSTAGAEGIEGKEGIVCNGGTIDVLATDDAMNANAPIAFNGAHVIARSKTNDAVDSNPKNGFFMPFGGNSQQNNDPAIVITGGTVYAWSQAGSPEEGFDSDFAPLAIEGGTVFSVGGGMGEMPSVPTNATAKQPTVLLIGVGIAKDEPVYIYNDRGKLIDTVTIPFALRRSASIVSHLAFKVGGTYTVKTKGYERTFTLDEPFTIVRRN